MSTSWVPATCLVCVLTLIFGVLGRMQVVNLVIVWCLLPRIVFKTDHSLGSRGDREEAGALRAGFRRAGSQPGPGALSGAGPGLVEGKGFPGRGKAGGQGTEARVRRGVVELDAHRAQRGQRAGHLEFVSQLGTLTLGAYLALPSLICKMGVPLGDVLGSNSPLWV